MGLSKFVNFLQISQLSYLSQVFPDGFCKLPAVMLRKSHRLSTVTMSMEREDCALNASTIVNALTFIPFRVQS